MTTYHGKNGYFAINDSGQTARNISPGLREAAINFEIPNVNSTGFTDSWDDSLIGIPGYKLNISGKWTDDTDTGTAVVLDALIGASQRFFKHAPGGSATGQRCYTGSVLMTAYNVTTPVAGMVAFTANFVGKGVMTASTM